MFQGVSALTLGAKGRMPTLLRHREALQLQAEGRVTMTKHLDGCLTPFPRPERECFRGHIAVSPMETHWQKRIFLDNAADVELDTAGHVLIIPEPCVAASLECDVMLLGMDNHFGVWDATTYTTKEQIAIAQGTPDAPKNFSF